MITSIISEIIQKISQNNSVPVYSAFDAVSIERKSKDFFTTVGLNSFDLQTPIYSAFTIFIPYKAEIDINVTAPENYSMQKLYEYFSDNIKSALNDISGMNCSIRKISMKHDSNINRLVLMARFSVSGIDKIERSSE